MVSEPADEMEERFQNEKQRNPLGRKPGTGRGAAAEAAAAGESLHVDESGQPTLTKLPPPFGGKSGKGRGGGAADRTELLTLATLSDKGVFLLVCKIKAPPTPIPKSLASSKTRSSAHLEDS